MSIMTSLQGLQQTAEKLSDDQLLQEARQPDPSIPNKQAVLFGEINRRKDLRQKYAGAQGRQQGPQITVADQILMEANNNQAGMSGGPGVRGFQNGGIAGVRARRPDVQNPSLAQKYATDLDEWRQALAGRAMHGYGMMGVADRPPQTEMQKMYSGVSPYEDMKTRFGKAYDIGSQVLPNAWEDVKTRFGKAYDIGSQVIPDAATAAGKGVDAGVAQMKQGWQATANQLMAKAQELENAIASGVIKAPAEIYKAGQQIAQLKQQAQHAITQMELGAKYVGGQVADKAAETVLGVPKAMYDAGQAYRESPLVKGAADVVLGVPKKAFDIGQTVSGIRSKVEKHPITQQLMLGAEATADDIKNSPYYKRLGEMLKFPTSDTEDTRPSPAAVGPGIPPDTVDDYAAMGNPPPSSVDLLEGAPITTAPAAAPASRKAKATGIRTPTISQRAEEALAKIRKAPDENTALKMFQENEKALGGGKVPAMIEAERKELAAERKRDVWRNIGLLGFNLAGTKERNFAEAVGPAGVKYMEAVGESDAAFRKGKRDLRRTELAYQTGLGSIAGSLAAQERTGDIGERRNQLAELRLMQEADYREKVLSAPGDRQKLYRELAGVPPGQTPNEAQRAKMVQINASSSRHNMDALRQILAGRRGIMSKVDKIMNRNETPPIHIASQKLSSGMTISQILNGAGGPKERAEARQIITDFVLNEDRGHPYYAGIAATLGGSRPAAGRSIPSVRMGPDGRPVYSGAATG